MNTTENNQNNSYVELWKFILVVVAIVLPLRLFVAKPFIVNGPSMDPTFATNQYLIVDQLTYHIEQPKRGDVIVFEYPYTPVGESSRYYIKRIIGLPGETIQLQYGKVSILNKKTSETTLLNEPYVLNTSFDNLTKTLGDHEYFVMGDNRPASSDSRSWGPLDKKYIVGRPIIRLFPFNKISLLPGSLTSPSKN